MPQAIISSAFESSVGLGQYASLAAALEDGVAAPCARQHGSASHGLDTASWFLRETAVSTPMLHPEARDAQVREQLAMCSPTWGALDLITKACCRFGCLKLLVRGLIPS